MNVGEKRRDKLRGHMFSGDSTENALSLETGEQETRRLDKERKVLVV